MLVEEVEEVVLLVGHDLWQTPSMMERTPSMMEVLP